MVKFTILCTNIVIYYLQKYLKDVGGESVISYHTTV